MAGGGADSQCGTLLVWDLQTFERTAAIEASKKVTVRLAFSPDGQALAMADWGGLVCLWDWATCWLGADVLTASHA